MSVLPIRTLPDPVLKQKAKKVTAIDEIEEFSIGHSIVARAIMVGMDQAVREMIALIKE